MVRLWRVGIAVCPMCHPLCRWPLARMRHREGNVLKDQAYCERLGASPLNSGECGIRVSSSPPDTWPRQAEDWGTLGATHLSVNTMDAGLRTPDAHITAIKQFYATIRG